MASQKPPSDHSNAVAAHQLPLIQSRETGDILPQARKDGLIDAGKVNPFAKSWAHFVAGG